MLRIAFALCALCAALPASAADPMVWSGETTDYGAMVTFGVPETDNSILAITCTKGSDEIVVRSAIGSKGLKAGQPAQLTLSNSGAKAVFTGEAVANDEAGSIDVEGRGKLADFQALIKTGKPFVLEVKGAKYGLNPDNIAKPLAALVSCKNG